MPRLRQGLFFLSLYLLALVPFAIIRFQDYNLTPLKIPVRYVILGIYFIIFSAYLFWINDRRQKEDSPRAWLLFFLVEAGLCFICPVFSGDMMYYLMRGRILGVYHLVTGEVPRHRAQAMGHQLVPFRPPAPGSAARRRRE